MPEDDEAPDAEETQVSKREPPGPTQPGRHNRFPVSTGRHNITMVRLRPGTQLCQESGPAPEYVFVPATPVGHSLWFLMAIQKCAEDLMKCSEPKGNKPAAELTMVEHQRRAVALVGYCEAAMKVWDRLGPEDIPTPIARRMSNLSQQVTGGGAKAFSVSSSKTFDEAGKLLTHKVTEKVMGGVPPVETPKGTITVEPADGEDESEE